MSAPTIQPIETKYAGCKFRSRLEARWAILFDHQGIEWHYEPDGFELRSDWKGKGKGPKRCPDRCRYTYLPDFWLPQVEMYAEVKPATPTHTELAKIVLLARKTEKPVLILDGSPKFQTYFAAHGFDFEEDRWTVELHEYDLFEGHQYWINERRFWRGDICDIDLINFELPGERIHGQDHPAVTAALSARFEHGACP